MNIYVNGKQQQVEAGTTIGDVVDAAVDDRRGVAVAVDDEVVTRATWATEVTPGTRIEVVAAVQGG